MRPLVKPQITAAQAYAACCGGVADADLRARLQLNSDLIDATEGLYDQHASASSLHLIARHPSLPNNISIQDMKDLYKFQMSAENGGGRAIYNALRNSAPNKKCPLCGIGIVYTLDHHLPQSKYPDLPVTPINLVPACADCNKAKLAKFPSVASRQTIHPYYDNYTAERWISITVHQGPPVTVEFRVSAPPAWPKADKDKVARHFEVFKLNTLFSSNANDELTTTKKTLVDLLTAGGPAQVRAHLLEQAGLYSARLNSWQFALYSDLSADGWFVAGGLNALPEPQ